MMILRLLFCIGQLSLVFPRLLEVTVLKTALIVWLSVTPCLKSLLVKIHTICTVAVLL
jgi:hypothetical protein